MELNHTLDLNSIATSKEAPDLVLAYTAENPPMQCDLSSPERAGLLQFWMRALTGKDDRDLLNRQIRQTRKGHAKFAPVGDSAMRRLQKSVSRIQGLSIDGEPVTKLTDEVYDKLPAWVLAALRKRLAEMSGEQEADEDEDEEGEDFAGE
jgi:hypothetical protein